MHLIAGSVAILLLLSFYPKLIKTLLHDWQYGLQLTSSVAIGGYIAGCLLVLVINFIWVIFRKKD